MRHWAELMVEQLYRDRIGFDECVSSTQIEDALRKVRNDTLEEAAEALEEFATDHQLSPAEAAATVRALKEEQK